MNSDVYDWDKIIEEREKELERIKRFRDIFEPIEGKDDWRLVVDTGQPRLIIHLLNDLHQARKFLRRAFGRWSDRFIHVFASGDTGIAVWSNEEEAFEIWLMRPIYDFPDLGIATGKYCGFVKTGATEEWDYVCKVES